MRACALFNIFPAVHDMVTVEEYRSSRVRDRAIFHLHGQRDGFFQAHVPRDVERLENKLAPLFQDCANRRTWVVVGYSGDNDPVARQLLKMKDFDHDLYWIGYRDTPMPKFIAPLMEEGRGGYWIGDSNWDADNFFCQLADRVGCEEPPFFVKPFTHLRETLDSVASFKLPGQDSEVPMTLDAIAKIDKAILCVEPSLTCMADGKASTPPGEDVVAKAKARLKAGKYEDVIALDGALTADGSTAAMDTLAWACTAQGAFLRQEAERLGGEAADRLLRQACDLHQRAIAHKPDMHEAFNNWGNALADQAKTRTGTEADGLFAQAVEKYRQAIALKPDMHDAFNNWGSAFTDQAETRTGPEADDLFAQAGEKYRQAIALKPDMHNAFYNWGITLALQAGTRTGAEADDLFAQAGDKYRQAIVLKPDEHEAFYNWGIALADQAKTRTGTEADDLFAQACEKYRQAIGLKPDMDNAFYNWGFALSERAKTRTGAEAEALFRAATEKCEQTNVLKLGSGAYNLACIAALQGRPEDCRHWLEVSRDNDFLPDRAHLEKDTDLDPVRELPWFTPFLDGLAP